jgi:predicted DNA-binding transcriptional regulator YafY
MSQNKLALLRFKTIDKCLQNRFRKWTLEDLIEEVSDALYDYEGIRTGVGKRTIQLDIQHMRSDKLGYNAPIIVLDKKYYAYEEKDYSITKSNVSANDLETLSDAVKVLNQFKGFSSFEDIGEMVSKLEDKILKQRNSKKTYISFEKNDLLKGLEWIESIYKSIKNEDVLDITYQSFKAKNPSKITIFPYLLKEYRNRWFVLCKTTKIKVFQNYALDRIQSIEKNINTLYIPADVDVTSYFDDVIGVTKTQGQKPFRIILKADASAAPYIITKPLHDSQVVLKSNEEELIFSIEVIPNYELEREILGFGESLIVINPRFLREKIKTRIGVTLGNYEV